MLIKLRADMTVREVKWAFHQAYPYLKLEFFVQEHATGEGTSLNKKVGDDTRLTDVRGFMKEGTINIEPQQTVAELEQQFQQRFNLPVQVFRKAISIWLETTGTDKLTLHKQNEMGKESTLGLKDVSTENEEE